MFRTGPGSETPDVADLRGLTLISKILMRVVLEGLVTGMGSLYTWKMRSNRGFFVQKIIEILLKKPVRTAVAKKTTPNFLNGRKYNG